MDDEQFPVSVTFAEPAKDPEPIVPEPEEPAFEVTVDSPTVPPPMFNVQSTLVTKSRRMAVIDGRVVREDAEIESGLQTWTVLRITAGSVFVRADSGETYELELK